MHAWRLLAAIGVAALGGCTSVYNLPHNQPLTGTVQALPLGSEVPLSSDDVMISLAFSGGGTRAAAFSFGVLKELDATRIRDRGKSVSLLDRVDFVSGVSGGSVLAAYYGLRKREALADFRERFLLRNAEEALNTRVSIANLGRAIGGGLNDDTHFPRWLDANLFGGATFRDVASSRRPRIWINASDIYNRTPFVFGNVAFDAMCSDLMSYPISEAVAASAAVPVVFAPIVLETYAGRCQTRLPDWIARARENRNAQPLLRDFAQAIDSYHTGSIRYVKLLDGGLVDNFGLSGFTIALLSATRPYEPLTPQQAARIRRVHVPDRRFRARAVGRLVATARGTDRRRPGDGDRRHRHRSQHARELHRVRVDHERLGSQASPLALRPVGGRAAAPGRRRRTGAATT